MGRVPATTSRWTPNKTSRPSNATWLHVLTTFLSEKQARRLNHVALEPHRDMALPQYDVARAFGLFSAQKSSSQRLPRHVALAREN